MVGPGQREDNSSAIRTVSVARRGGSRLAAAAPYLVVLLAIVGVAATKLWYDLSGAKKALVASTQTLEKTISPPMSVAAGEELAHLQRAAREGRFGEVVSDLGAITDRVQAQQGRSGQDEKGPSRPSVPRGSGSGTDSGLTKKAALTFDDFPMKDDAGDLLAALRKADVRATLFVIGSKAIAGAKLLNEALQDGHVLGNHTFSHRRLTELSAGEIRLEIDYCSQTMERVTGIRPRYIRPPGGQYSEIAERIIDECGLRLVLWDVSSKDYLEPPSEQVVSDVLRNLGGRNRAIVMLHDGSRSTIEAVPTLARKLRSRGYELVTLDELYGEG